MNDLYETAGYWEGALHYLRKIFSLRDKEFLERIKLIESIDPRDADIETFIFLSIWNNYGQLKWLKAFLIRHKSPNVFLTTPYNDRDLRGMYRVAIEHENEDLLWLCKFFEIHLHDQKKYRNPLHGGTNSLHLMYEGGSHPA